MAVVCPNGHSSEAADYCDVCGAPIDSSARSAPPHSATPPAPTAAAAATPSGAVICPHCSTENVAEALFCEACGYDFTTGTLPRPEESVAGETPAPDVVTTVPAAPAAPDAPPAPADRDAAAVSGFSFVAEVWIDPAWYEAQQSPDPLPSPGPPEVVALKKSSVLVGRLSRSRNIHPDIDCEPDSGASRRQAQLTTDGTRWWVEDLESANGTFVAPASEPVPEDPIPVGSKHELKPGDRVYVGAWTRIVIRPATPEERQSLA